ncbi:MAG: hypothetical protein ACRDFQ_02210 [Anaerolineales bacterium]
MLYSKASLHFIFTLCALLLLAACAPAPAAATPTVSETPAETATPAPPTLTPIPLDSATAIFTSTPSVPQVAPISAGVNCRVGPATHWLDISYLLLGQTAQIVGSNTDTSWWYIQDPQNPGGVCWVAASVVIASGPLTGIPVVPPPTASVTNVTVDASVSPTVYCAGPNPIQFSGTITTNGPATVTFQWEVTGDKTNTTTPETITFDAFGAQDVPNPGAYSADCGQYTITLHVLTPNDNSASKNFQVQP